MSEKLENMLQWVDDLNLAKTREVLLVVLSWRPRPSRSEEVLRRDQALYFFDKLNEDWRAWKQPAKDFLRTVCQEAEAKFAGIYKSLQ